MIKPPNLFGGLWQCEKCGLLGATAFFGNPFSFDLLCFQSLLDPIVGLGNIFFVAVYGVRQVGSLASEEVHVSHGIVVFWIDLERMLQVIDALFNLPAPLGLEFFANLVVLDGTGIFRLHA